MNAPLRHPVVPAADQRQEAPSPAPKPQVVYIDLDALDQNKFQGVRSKSSFSAWRGA